MGTDNIFDNFEDTAQSSKGLNSLENTKIILASEQRTKNCISVVTPTEHKSIRMLCRELEDKFDKRITASDLGRELFLLLLGNETQNIEVRDELLNRLKENIL